MKSIDTWYIVSACGSSRSRRPFLGKNLSAAPDIIFDQKNGQDIFALLAKIGARFAPTSGRLLRTGGCLGRRNGSMQWRFLFWHRQKRKKRYFCKSNKTPPLVSARNHKKML